jgi:integrase
LFWWDHVITLVGTGLRIGELAGLHRRRVHLNQPMPTLQVVDVRYQAGSQFGSGFKPRPKSDASIREIPLAPQVVEAIRRRLPPGSDPAALLFTGPGGGPGHRGSPGVKKGTRTVVSRHNFRRTYHGALAKLANPATAGLRPTAARVLRALHAHGPLTAEQLASQLSTQGRTVRVATIDQALAELAAAGAAAADPQTQRWARRPATQHPLLEAVDLHGAHDFRHTFSTWLEDAGIPARVIDELMGHQASGRTGRHAGSAIGAHYRHTTPEMAARITTAIEERLVVVLTTAGVALDQQVW